MNFTLLGFVIYLLIVLVVGFITFKRNKSHNDFFIAGRKLNPWVVALSERASGESAWLLLGLPGAALAAGFMEAWTALGCVIGIIFYWYVIAEDLRIQSENVKAITLPNFFAEKLGNGGPVIRVVATLIIIFFFTFYLAAQFNGAGKVLNVTFGIPDNIGILIGVIVIVFYTMMGGFFAVAWTDLVQGIIMIGALVVLPIVGLFEVIERGSSISEAVSASGAKHMSLVSDKTGWAAVALIVSGLSWAFGYMGQPHLLTRFMAIKDSGKIKVSRRIAFAWAIPAFAGAMMIGIIGMALYGTGYFEDIERIMPHMANELLPAWLAGVFISGAIAAMMSTADSQLLVITSSVVEDFYHKTLHKEVSKKSMLSISRAVTIIVGLVGFIIAITSDKLIFALVSYAWAGLGASFGPALLLLLKWKKTTWQGVLGGMITGTIITVIWSSIDACESMVSARFTSFVFAFIAVVLISKLTQKK